MTSASKTRDPGSNLATPILTLAALLGKESSIDWLLSMSGERASIILSELERGVGQGLLKQAQLGVYAFSDPSKQEECLSSLSKEEETRLRRHMADSIRREYPDEASILPVLVHQLMHMPNDLADCRSLFEAGESFRKVYQHQDALRCYERAIRSLRPLPGEDADRLFVETVLPYSRIFSPFQDSKEICVWIREAILRAEGSVMQPFQPLLKMHLAKFMWYDSRHGAAIKQFNEGWAMAQAGKNPAVRRYAATLRMSFFFWQGRFRDVVSVHEEIAPKVGRYPRSRFPIESTIFLGLSLSFGGRATEGIGMLKGLQTHCQKIGTARGLAEASSGLGQALLISGRVEEGTAVLEGIRQSSSDEHHTRRAYLCEAYALKKDYGKAEAHLKACLRHGNVPIWQILLTGDGRNRMAAEMKDDALHRLTGLTPERMIQSAVKSKDIHTRGMVYLYKARRLVRRGKSPNETLRALKLAMKWLAESGYEIQLAKVRFESARLHLIQGHPEEARDAALAARQVLEPINPSLIPDDLRGLLSDRPTNVGLAKEISALGQEIVGIRDNRQLARRILASLIRLTAAERGAIFLTDDDGASPDPKLEATMNLAEDMIGHPGFGASMEAIRGTIRHGRSRIVKTDPAEATATHFDWHNQPFRSCFCVPMVLRGKTIGALYCDNQLFDSAIKDTDLDALTFLAGQAAIAIDHARAYEKIRLLNRQLTSEKQYFVEQERSRPQSKDFIGESPAMRGVFNQIDRVADQDTVVLIGGETGAGKELVARTIQKRSKRKDGPFITADCTALAETLIASELFGHEAGAFTGARSRKVGRFELANGGTLFLDEIGNMSMDIQTRLLRVLQTKEFQRVGGLETIRSDFRLITATNKDLGQEIAAGRFREDLYYRLNVFPIIVPPLRDRKEDIPPLTHYFLRMYSAKTGKPFDGILQSEMDKLLAYAWPGNVRELQNVIERGAILSSGSRFGVPPLSHHPEDLQGTETLSLADMERLHIKRTLETTGGKISGKTGAAEALGLPYSTLYAKMKKLGIRPGGEPAR